VLAPFLLVVVLVLVPCDEELVDFFLVEVLLLALELVFEVGLGLPPAVEPGLELVAVYNEERDF
jgi:hypothetical protein